MNDSIKLLPPQTTSGFITTDWRSIMSPNIYTIPKELKEKDTNNPLSVQVGGDHYKKYKIQPLEYAHANNLDMFQGSIVKYITRFRDKNGKQDLEKIKHFVDVLIELEYGTEKQE